MNMYQRTEELNSTFRGHVQTIIGKINAIVTLSSDPPLNVTMMLNLKLHTKLIIMNLGRFFM